MQALTSDRLTKSIEDMRQRIADKPQEDMERLDKEMDLEFGEHFQYQEMQARAHVQGLLTPEAAQIVYVALGEVGSTKNGGWAVGTDLATKVVVTKLIAELAQLMIAGRMK